jgi:ATP-dependent Clp protease adapter protein ClpS
MSTETQTRRKVQIKKPGRYCNIFLNNSVTPFEHVMHILMKVFNYDKDKALQKTQEIHIKQEAVVFTSSKEICSFKKELVDKEKQNIKETFLEHRVELCGETI